MQQEHNNDTRNFGSAATIRLPTSSGCAAPSTIEHSLARRGAARLRRLLDERPFIRALGALTGNQAMQQVKAGLEAIYVSGWQVAADANNAGEMYPDQSLYPVVLGAGGRSAHQQDVAARRPDRQARGRQLDRLVRADRRRCGGRLRRPAQRLRADEEHDRGGRRRRSISRISSRRKRSAAISAARCWFRPQSFIRTLNAARLAADVCGVDTLVVARTDAHSATLITSDVDELRPSVDFRRAHRRKASSA